MSREEEKFKALRNKAEQLLSASSESFDAETQDFMDLLHELRVHQKELEIQNEELRETQEELSSLYSEYADLYEFAPVTFITLTPKGIIRRINLNGVTLLGRERMLLLRSGLIAFIAEESTADYYAALRQASETGGPQRTMIALRPTEKQAHKGKKNKGRTVWVQMDVAADTTETGQLLQWRLAIADISARVEAEQEASTLLQEKNQLLREVHHRIKNQMHSIASIISYQMGQYESPETTQALEGVVERIHVMQSLYDLLSTETSQTSIQLTPYLRKLLHYLREAYKMNDAIQIHSDIAELEISAQHSLPLGIIINEGLVNALKYAFVHQEKGNIWLTVRRDDTGRLRIHIADDGEGLPYSEGTKAQEGFGLTLIRNYARQLNGEIHLSRRDGGGTEMSLNLSLEE